jgi:hypothetical protein
MPSASARNRPALKAEIVGQTARTRSNAALGALGRARRRGFDPALAERIVAGVMSGARLEAVLAGDPELPCRPTLRRWRREAPVFDAALKEVFATARARRDKAIPAELAAFVVDWIKDGETFASLARKRFA